MAASSPSTRLTGLFARRLFLEPCDKKTTYDTHNTTTVVNVTTLENRTVLENARPRRGTYAEASANSKSKQKRLASVSIR